MKLTPSAILAALVLMGAGGFIAGRVSSADASPGEQDGPAETKSSRSLTRDAGGNAGGNGKAPRLSRPDRDAKITAKDRLARLDAIIRGENPLERNRALLAFIDRLGPGEFEDAVAHFRELGITDSRMGEYSLLLSAWAQADPTSALAYAKENTNGGFAQEAILTSWASTDPDAAIRWAQANFDGEGANPYLPGIIRSLAISDPARATELLASMPRSEERGKGLDFFLPHLLQQGTGSTRAWIDAITDETLKNGAMMRAARQLAAADPAGTAAWLIANPGEASQRRLDDVYSAWATRDQQAAVSSLAALPAGENRGNALGGVVRSVASEDPKAALALMDRFPNDVNDRVIRDFVWQSLGSDPETALSQIGRIGNEQDREQTYRRALGAWTERDPASANAWQLKISGSSGVFTPR